MRSRLPPIAGVTLAAVLLRLVLLLGRGDYLAFDEGWYLLLGRSLWMGQGYELIGTPHVTLSPLFPALAGAVGRAIGDWVWGAGSSRRSPRGWSCSRSGPSCDAGRAIASPSSSRYSSR